MRRRWARRWAIMPRAGPRRGDRAEPSSRSFTPPAPPRRRPVTADNQTEETGRMAMDIEGFVEAPGRAGQVEQVREKIDQLGIEYLYLQFVSITGRICGKGIPADHWESIAERGFQLVYGATVNLFVNRHGQYLGYGPQDKELVRHPGGGNVLPAPLGQACGAAVVHVVPQPRGAPGSRRVPDLGLSRQPAPDSRSVQGRTRAGCTCATAPSRK